MAGNGYQQSPACLPHAWKQQQCTVDPSPVMTAQSAWHYPPQSMQLMCPARFLTGGTAGAWEGAAPGPPPHTPLPLRVPQAPHTQKQLVG